MSLTTVRRAGLAASAAALALLVSACGSDGGDKADDGKTAQADKTASASPAQAPAKALTGAELEKAALTQADVKSGKVFTKVPLQDDITQAKVKTDKPECAPLGHLQAGTYEGQPAATVKRSWLADRKKPDPKAGVEEALVAGIDRAKAIVTLASYDDGGAEKAFAALKTAATACANGYAWTVGSDTTKVGKVTATTAPQGGDEALALTLLVDADEGVKAPAKAVVVRKGATLAYFSAYNMASAATGKDWPFPDEIVQAQLTKLG
ncbi:hypothetical protein C3489_10375 [Streptomyces sp. Ru71]|uniref:hypothetical protein n=1 Tax=Streptomyces sp. Ru71 TaxID=2080746 RepID=UPI000CDCF0FD|nr:hypothetical protein [Streptomyces sp. Ru71]POX55447.1 hypothetical protein C3489_10375 [Streptomyces sp. Ru71]